MRYAIRRGKNNMVKEKLSMTAKCKEIIRGVGEKGEQRVLGRMCTVTDGKMERRTKVLILEEDK